MSLFTGVTLKEGEKRSDIKQKVTWLSLTSCVSGTIKKDPIIIPTGNSVIFKVHLVKKKRDKTRI